MKNKPGLVLGFSLALLGAAAAADKTTLDQCRAVKAELNRLEGLRKEGGTAKKMDGWKRRIHDQQDEYSRLYCRQYRFELDRH